MYWFACEDMVGSRSLITAEVWARKAIVNALRFVRDSYYLTAHMYYTYPHVGCKRQSEAGEDCSLGQTCFRRAFWEVTRSSDATASLKVTPEHVHRSHPC
jgi:hypothetical protein